MITIEFQLEPIVTSIFQSSLSILRRKDVQKRVGLSRSTIYDKLNPRSKQFDPSFPKPIALGGRAIGWVEAEIQQWLEQRIEASRATVKQGHGHD